MKNNKKVYVSIYCKIYTDCFSDEMFNRKATGQEIYEFLLKDAKQCFDEKGQLIPGDCHLWYLGCNEKFGHLALGYDLWSWNIGESSFDNVEAFVSTLYQKKLITGFQFHTLMGKIDEGGQIDNMYDIKDYLICKREGRPWDKKPGAENFRSDLKRRVLEGERSFRDRGYIFYKR